MVIAITNAVALYANKEGSWNEVPAAPAMQQLRFTGESLVFKKKTTVSSTIRSDRMRDNVLLVGWDTSGDINYELEFFDYDSFFEGVMYSTWTGVSTVSGSNISFGANAITSTSSVFGSVPVNAYVRVNGSTVLANNQRYRVTAATGTTLTVTPSPTASAAGSAITITVDGLSTATSATVTANSVTWTTNAFNPTTSTNLVVGQWVGMSGFNNAVNNTIRRVAAITANSITFTDSNGTAETTTLAPVITGRTLRNGVTPQSYHLQKAFTDIGQYVSFRGMRVDDMKMNINSGDIITGSFSFMGAQAIRATSSWAGSTFPTNSTASMTASGNVARIWQNGAAVPAGVKQVQMEVKNNLRASEQVGNLYPYAIGYGDMDVTGTIDVYFENSTMYDQLVNHTATELSWTVTDTYGNSYVVTLPTVLFTDGYPQAGSINTDVTISLSFQAVRNATYGCQVQIDAVPGLT